MAIISSGGGRGGAWKAASGTDYMGIFRLLREDPVPAVFCNRYWIQQPRRSFSTLVHLVPSHWETSTTCPVWLPCLWFCCLEDPILSPFLGLSLFLHPFLQGWLPCNVEVSWRSHRHSSHAKCSEIDVDNFFEKKKEKLCPCKKKIQKRETISLFITHVIFSFSVTRSLTSTRIE